jgi:hypothetical protein
VTTCCDKGAIGWAEIFGDAVFHREVMADEIGL